MKKKEISLEYQQTAFIYTLAAFEARNQKHLLPHSSERTFFQIFLNKLPKYLEIFQNFTFNQQDMTHFFFTVLIFVS